MANDGDVTILLAGASVRAAAASAIRAGHRPRCVDLFGDADLARACPTQVVPLDRYPDGLIERLSQAPMCPWMYTGGLENYPALFARPTQPLWGNSAEVARAVRDPVRFSDALVSLDAPRLGERTDRTTRWLVKPRRGSAGIGIRDWRPGEVVPRECYLQEWVAGESAAAVYVAAAGRASMLGTTRQLIGTPWLHAPGTFYYAGSIGPLDCSRDRLQMLGQSLVDAFGLLGVFGVDFLLDGDRIRPVEVNPRYPASFEILERIARQPLLRLHMEAFEHPVGQVSDLPRLTEVWPGASRHRGSGAGWKPTLRCHGKAILFARTDLVFPEDGPWNAAFEFRLADLDVPFADIPAPGQRISRGSPVLTFFAAADSQAECEAELRKIAFGLDRSLGGR